MRWQSLFTSAGLRAEANLPFRKTRGSRSNFLNAEDLSPESRAASGEEILLSYRLNIGGPLFNRAQVEFFNLGPDLVLVAYGHKDHVLWVDIFERGRSGLFGSDGFDPGRIRTVIIERQVVGKDVRHSTCGLFYGLEVTGHRTDQIVPGHLQLLC